MRGPALCSLVTRETQKRENREEHGNEENLVVPRTPYLTPKKIGNSLREDVRWTYAVHERTLPAVRRVNAPVRWTEVTVRHTGYTDPALRERKLQRDCKILESELAQARRLWRMVQGACPDDVEATARSDP